MNQKSYDQSPSLYLIPTPIGNMEDITYRAISILKEVDFVLCEDTRVTGQLLKYFGIQKKMIACHDHNENQLGEFVIESLQQGKTIGLVTDRGTPIISDPGYKIVECVLSHHFNVIGLPGPTALIPALISSGINPSPFLFYGFLNAKEGKRTQELDYLKKLPYTMIFYEAPHRIGDTLKTIMEVFGDRHICLCREISKLYEEMIRGKISEILPRMGEIRGELVLVVEGNTESEDYSSLTIQEHIQLYLEDGMSEKEALKKVAVERNLPKSVIYKEYHLQK